MANNVQEALKKEKKIKADEAWIDQDWKTPNPEIVVGYKNIAKEEKYHKKEQKKPKKKRY